MRTLARLFPLWLLAMTACAARPDFDPMDPSAWTQRGGKAVYTFENGMIVGETRPNQPNSFLCTTREFADFVLEFDVLVDPELNSGVQIRSHSRPDYQSGRVHGLQVEIDPGPRAWTAGIYDEGRRGWLADLKDNAPAREAFRKGEWNHIKVEAGGDRIRTWLNGVPAADLRDSTDLVGFIGLQVHDVGPRTEPLRVRWRNITLRPVEAAGQRPAGAALMRH